MAYEGRLAMKDVLICLDWDGTVMDTFSKIHAAIQESAKRCGFELPAHMTLDQILGWTPEKIWSKMQCATLKPVKPQYFFSQIKQLIHQTPSSLFPRAREALDLASGMADIVVVSNRSSQLIRAEIEREGICDYFLHIYSAHEYRRKPNPEMILQAQIDYPNRHVVMIGDSFADRSAAKRAGVEYLEVDHYLDQPCDLFDVMCRLVERYANYDRYI